MIIFWILALTLICGHASADWNVTDYGAAGDGVADNTVAFQKALDEAGKEGGGIVNVPAGTFAIKGNLSIPAAVTLQGCYKATPLAHPVQNTKLTGTVLYAYAGRGSNEGEPFIKLNGDSSAVVGLIISYPEWKPSDIPPVPYPPCISAREGTNNVAIIDVAIINAYEGIKLVQSHRHLIRNFQGYPSWRGIYIDQCYDIGRIENVHIWPFGIIYTPDDPYCKWVNLNGTAFEFGRADWEYVTNTFCFGYGVGYKFSQTKDGSCNGSFLSIGADCCERAVLVEQCPPFGLLITNGEFVGRWSSTEAITLDIGEKVDGKVSLTNCSFWGPIDTCVRMRAPKGQFTANACNFVHWDSKLAGSPAIVVDAGRAIIQGNTFAERKLTVRVGKDAKSVILMGNQAQGGIIVDNKAGKCVQMIGNEQGIPPMLALQRENYIVSLGTKGDQQLVKWFYTGEKAIGGKGTMRWSLPDKSQFILPVVSGKAYTITVDGIIPEAAIQPDAGLYLGSKKLIAFSKPGAFSLSGSIPASKSGMIILDIRCKGWVPSKVTEGNTDNRTFGISLQAIRMIAKGAGSRIFNANTGEWIKGK